MCAHTRVPTRSLRGGVDHMCRLGGAIAGAVVGLCLRFLFLQWSQNNAAAAAASAGIAGGAAAIDSTVEAGACDATSVLDANAENHYSSYYTPVLCLGLLAMLADLN